MAAAASRPDRRAQRRGGRLDRQAADRLGWVGQEVRQGLQQRRRLRPPNRRLAAAPTRTRRADAPWKRRARQHRLDRPGAADLGGLHPGRPATSPPPVQAGPGACLRSRAARLAAAPTLADPTPPAVLPPVLDRPGTAGPRLVLGATWELATAGGGLQGVAYDPGANRWRRLAPSPQSPQLAGRHLLDRTTVWAGSRLLVFNYWSRSARDPGIVSQTGMTVEPDGCEVWAYDPATERWTTLPPPSSQIRALLAHASLVWDGRDVVAVANRNVITVPPRAATIRRSLRSRPRPVDTDRDAAPTGRLAHLDRWSDHRRQQRRPRPSDRPLAATAQPTEGRWRTAGMGRPRAGHPPLGRARQQHDLRAGAGETVRYGPDALAAATSTRCACRPDHRRRGSRGCTTCRSSGQPSGWQTQPQPH